MNNWDAYVDAFVVVTSKWARLFFVAFWVIGYLSCFNIVIAAILNKHQEREKKYKRRSHVAPVRSTWNINAPKGATFEQSVG
eukprot:gene54317-10077_t